MAAAITSLMTGTSYKRSAELAAVVGPYAGYARNADAHKRVMRKHQAANDAVRTLHVADAAGPQAGHQGVGRRAWRLGEKNGFRNAQASVLAPTGTIGFMMDCDTTGIEPDFSLVKFKKLVGGGSMQIVNQTVPRALRKLGYQPEQVEAIVDYIAEHGHVIDAPGLKTEHYEVFDCAMGARALKPMGHVRMMAAAQPFLSGAISKTVNLPESATVEEIEDIYLQSWKLGLKATAIYRDNCKVGQPLSDGKGENKGEARRRRRRAEVETKVVEKIVYAPTRKRLPKSRASRTTSFTVGGAEGYMTSGAHDDGELGEVFLKLGKQGSTLAGVMDAFSIAVSIGLQYGVPLETYVSKFTNLRFEPAGLTDDPDVRMAQSIMDYIFRRLALDYLPFETRSALGIYSAEERQRHLETGSYEPIEETGSAAELIEIAPDGRRRRSSRRSRRDGRRSRRTRPSRPRTPSRAPPSPPPRRPTPPPSCWRRSPAPPSTPRSASPAAPRCAPPAPATSARAAAAPAAAADLDQPHAAPARPPRRGKVGPACVHGTASTARSEWRPSSAVRGIGSVIGLRSRVCFPSLAPVGEEGVGGSHGAAEQDRGDRGRQLRPPDGGGCEQHHRRPGRHGRRERDRGALPRLVGVGDDDEDLQTGLVQGPARRVRRDQDLRARGRGGREAGETHPGAPGHGAWSNLHDTTSAPVVRRGPWPSACRTRSGRWPRSRGVPWRWRSGPPTRSGCRRPA